MIVLEENRAREEHAATQAGRPRPAGLPYKRSPPRLPFSAGKHPSHSSICVLKFSCPESP
jgi:hypothetical protein